MREPVGGGLLRLHVDPGELGSGARWWTNFDGVHYGGGESTT